MRKFKVWLDSGANVHSQYFDYVTLDELGFSDDQWDALNDDQKDEQMRDVAFARADWGYVEVDADESED